MPATPLPAHPLGRRPRRPARPGHGARGATVALVVCLLGAPAGCAPPDRGAAGPGPVLSVATSGDGAVARLDAGTGRPLGPPLPAGPLPWQLARGADGSLLALSASPAAARPLTHLGHTGAGWAARPVALPGPRARGPPRRRRRALRGGGRPGAGGAPATDPGAGRPGCRLTLVDVPAGAVAAAARAAACGPDDFLTGLALADGPGGPVAYLALWRLRPDAPEAPDPSGAPSGAHRVVAVDARTGATRAVFRTGGAPVLLALGAAPGRLGPRLYGVERLAGAEDESASPGGARLLGLHPTTLEVESERRLDFVPARLVVAPDGDVAYALHDHRLTRLGLAGGADRSVALPARGLALAVGRDRVYVSSASSGEVWAFRRRDGRLVATLPVGRFATELLVSPAE